RPWFAGIEIAQLGEQELGLGSVAGGLVTAVDLQRIVGHNRRQAVSVVQFPVVDETVVAGGALHGDAEENLRGVLGGLHLDDLAGVDVAAPLDALDEALGLGRRADQLADEPVIGLVLAQRAVKPGRDRLAAAVDVAGAGVVVAQQVVPERQPVLGICLLIVQ